MLQKYDMVAPFSNQLAGGTASMQQLKERLEKDLLEVLLFNEAPT